MDVKDFVTDFRNRLGDTTGSVPVPYIITYINTALRRLARQDGLEKMFGRRDTFELATINKDGTYAAGWDMGKVGKILDIPNLKMLVLSNAQIKKLTPKYIEFDDFFNLCHLPEQQSPGYPHYWTIEQIGSINRLLFDRPPCDLVALDMVYSAFAPPVTSINDTIPLAWEYCDVLVDYVIILHKAETTDMATARALYEDLDVLTADLVELLAKRKSGLPYRRIRRSF